MSVVTKGPWILPDLFVIYDFVKKNNERERKKEREQEMPIFVLSSKCKSVQSQYECRKKLQVCILMMQYLTMFSNYYLCYIYTECYFMLNSPAFNNIHITLMSYSAGKMYGNLVILKYT